MVGPGFGTPKAVGVGVSAAAVSAEAALGESCATTAIMVRTTQGTNVRGLFMRTDVGGVILRGKPLFPEAKVELVMRNDSSQTKASHAKSAKDAQEAKHPIST